MDHMMVETRKKKLIDADLVRYPCVGGNRTKVGCVRAVCAFGIVVGDGDGNDPCWNIIFEILSKRAASGQT